MKAGHIEIKGARVHNLKNIDIQIERNRFIVVTGLSGSGKSSLAFDTLYAEGQRRYVESLSSYARQFLGRINKPEADYIKGIPPAIAIEQKVNTRNPRSTVGTSTEIYDYLKLLYARLGKTYSPVTGQLVKRHNVSDIVDFMCSFPEKTPVTILSPIFLPEKRACREHLEILSKQGFTRIEILSQNEKTEKIHKINEILTNDSLSESCVEMNLIIDRISVSNDEDSRSRMADSAQTALYEGNGYCVVSVSLGEQIHRETFSTRFEADGIMFEEPTVNTFSFNNPLGACPRCEGYGMVIGIDEDLVVPNKNLSIYQEAVACWKGEKMNWWRDELIRVAPKIDFPIHTPYYKLTAQQRKTLWEGNKHFKGLNAFFAMLEAESYKIQYRVMLSRYRGKTTCPECEGTRLKKETRQIKVGDVSLPELVNLPVAQLLSHFENLTFSAHDQVIAKRLMIEIVSRLRFLNEVGLGYLTLNRLSATLSGGESQRINLATSLGSSLVGSLYILDEPSIGLHPRDTHRLIGVLEKLKQLGNTVLVVEHDEDIMRAADQIIDIGPLAGIHGGAVVFQGTHDQMKETTQSLTADYLYGRKKIALPALRRNWNHFIEIVAARENNLKEINVKFPLNVLTVVTGVSGSGKSSLVGGILFPYLNKNLNGIGMTIGKHGIVQGDLHLVGAVEFIDQNPIGRSSRSNPVTYIKAYDEIRKLFSEQQAAKINGFTPSTFSFNTPGGRCEECQGEGNIKVEMQFMADVVLTCESCHGKRFKDEVLEVQYHSRNIFDVLEMSVAEAIVFFEEGKGATEKRIVDKLRLLEQVGLDYVKLGQSSSTLSGGESQRIKLASFLGREKAGVHTLFIFDEPSTGLHFHDIHKLLQAFDALLNNGNSLIVVEHNPDIIKSADWVIDLGPEGGENGGQLVFEGTPEALAACDRSYTAHFLRDKLAR